MKSRKSMNPSHVLAALALLPWTTDPVLANEQEVTMSEELQITHEAEDIVVTAARTETLLKEATKSIDIVDSEDREELQQYFLPELLDNEPGVFLRSLGGVGQWSNISIRGAGSQHTQYQYNGMPLRDAADTQSTLQYFIEDMYSGASLDRVEILKGTNSTLYGSQAMGGVINIIPKKWQSGPTAEWRNEFGPNNTAITNARAAYGQEKFYVDVNPLYVTTDGANNNGPHGYWYDNTGATFGAGVKPTDRTALEFSALFTDSDVALGSSPSLGADGSLVKNQAYADQHREGQFYQLGLNWTQAISSLWDYSLKGSQGTTERHYFWSATNGDQSQYEGETSYLELQHNLHVNQWLTFNLGADYEQSEYDGQEPKNPYAGDYTPVRFEESWGSKDAFGQAQLALLDRSLFLNLGGRYNDHEAFDGEAVWETSAAYLFKNTGTKVHAHVGTGYRTPGLYEIYGGYLYNGNLVTVGNPDLQPEKSTSYEMGVDQSLAGGKVQVGVTYFETRFDDMIIFDNTAMRYENAKEGESSGVETSIRLHPWKLVRFDLAYTYIDSRSKADQDADWSRNTYLPRNKVDFIVTFYPMDKLTMAVDVNWQDEKIVPLYDAGWNSVRWEEDGVTTVNLSTTYKALQNMDLFARVDNLFDKAYTESGYCMPGISVYGGLKVHF